MVRPVRQGPGSRGSVRVGSGSRSGLEAGQKSSRTPGFPSGVGVAPARPVLLLSARRGLPRSRFPFSGRNGNSFLFQPRCASGQPRWDRCPTSTSTSATWKRWKNTAVSLATSNWRKRRAGGPGGGRRTCSTPVPSQVLVALQEGVAPHGFAAKGQGNCGCLCKELMRCFGTRLVLF